LHTVASSGGPQPSARGMRIVSTQRTTETSHYPLTPASQCTPLSHARRRQQTAEGAGRAVVSILKNHHRFSHRPENTLVQFSARQTILCSRAPHQLSRLFQISDAYHKAAVQRSGSGVRSRLTVVIKILHLIFFNQSRHLI